MKDIIAICGLKDSSLNGQNIRDLLFEDINAYDNHINQHDLSCYSKYIEYEHLQNYNRHIYFKQTFLRGSKEAKPIIIYTLKGYNSTDVLAFLKGDKKINQLVNSFTLWDVETVFNKRPAYHSIYLIVGKWVGEHNIRTCGEQVAQHLYNTYFCKEIIQAPTFYTADRNKLKPQFVYLVSANSRLSACEFFTNSPLVQQGMVEFNDYFAGKNSIFGIKKHNYDYFHTPGVIQNVVW